MTEPKTCSCARCEGHPPEEPDEEYEGVKRHGPRCSCEECREARAEAAYYDKLDRDD